MPRRLLASSSVQEVLATARQVKTAQQAILPFLLLQDMRGRVDYLPLPGLATDAQTRRAQFFALGRNLPHIVQALFVCESWFVAGAGTGCVQPSRHPARQEAILLTGCDRAGGRTLLILQAFQKRGKGIRWQSPIRTTNPVDGVGPLDYFFAP